MFNDHSTNTINYVFRKNNCCKYRKYFSAYSWGFGDILNHSWCVASFS